MTLDSNDQQRIASSADLLRRGASLLGEACPKCGGVQIKYQNKRYCLNEDDLPAILSAGSTESISSEASPTSQRSTEKNEQQGLVKTERETLRKVLEEKLIKVSKQLESSDDIEEQQKLLELISKYVDTLGKIK